MSINTVFFIFLITSLFLGDGKQPFVDVWWALGILTMFGVRYYRRGRLDLQPLPRPTGALWMALIVYYALLIPFSDSAGYSISATIRLIEGYLVYVLFIALTRDSRNQGPSDSGNQSTALFVNGLLLVGVIATLASFVFLLSPPLARFLPPMNLLYANYGHNHLADLLLFVIPVVIELVEKKKNTGSVGALVLLVAGMIFTFARGAWILLSLYLVFRFIKQRNDYGKRISLVVGAIVAVVFLTTSLVSVYGVPQKNRYLQPINAFVFKPPLPSDNRWEYWWQATESMKERPLFGSGPGVFSLLSRRHQSAPNSWSWFAHSFPLQAAAEIGIIGALLTLMLLFVALRNIYPQAADQKDDKENRGVLWGMGLVLFYGLFEFSLDYATIWILLCASLGQVIRRSAGPGAPRREDGFPGAMVAVVGVFYVASLVSGAADVLQNPRIAWLLAPHNLDRAKDLYDRRKDRRPTEIETASLWFFHKANPEALSIISKIESDEERKATALEALAAADPWGDGAITAADALVAGKLWERAAAVLVAKQGHEADLVQKKSLTSRMLSLGDGLYENGKTFEAGLWYRRAQEVDSWSLDQYEPVFLRARTSAGARLAFFEAPSAVPGFLLGKYRDAYSAAWKEALLDVVRSGDYEEMVKHARGIVSLSPWKKNNLWQELGGLLVGQIEKEAKEGNSSMVIGKALSIGKLFYELAGQQASLDFPLRERASSVLMQLGNKVAMSDLVTAEQLQATAVDMVPWVGNHVHPWYDDLTLKRTIPSITYIQYLGRHNDPGGVWIQKSRSHAAIILVDKLVSEEKFIDVYRYATNITVPSEINYEERKSTAIRLQQKADALFAANKLTEAEPIVRAMKYVLPEDYWIQAQEGYFYLAAGDKQKAKDAFTSCLEARSEGHKDCAFGLREASGRRDLSHRFEQISRIFQGKAEWTEFVSP